MLRKVCEVGLGGTGLMEHFRRVEEGAEYALREVCSAKPSQRILPPRQSAWQCTE